MEKEITINYLIELLKKDDINSKKLVINILENLNIHDCVCLRRSINERMNILIGKEVDKNGDNIKKVSNS